VSLLKIINNSSDHMKRCLLPAILLVFISTIAFSQQTEKIEGRYFLYPKDNPLEKTGEMIITAWKADVFLVRGTGWVGQGELKENKGFYEWKFDDGKTGRTVFEVNPEGELAGHVVGSGINWKYIARRTKE
jgi:hypothetical protein